jgi:hypothetical protein
MIETPVRSSFAPATRAACNGAIASSTCAGSASAKRWRTGSKAAGHRHDEAHQRRNAQHALALVPIGRCFATSSTIGGFQRSRSEGAGRHCGAPTTRRTHRCSCVSSRRPTVSHGSSVQVSGWVEAAVAAASRILLGGVDGPPGMTKNTNHERGDDVHAMNDDQQYPRVATVVRFHQAIAATSRGQNSKAGDGTDSR